jgi:hypothetical protein
MKRKYLLAIAGRPVVRSNGGVDLGELDTSYPQKDLVLNSNEMGQAESLFSKYRVDKNLCSCIVLSD